MKEVYQYLQERNKYQSGMQLPDGSVIRACVLCGNLYYIPWNQCVKIDCICNSLECQTRLEHEEGLHLQPSVRKRLSKMMNG